MNCRFCAAPLERLFVDLGAAPPSNAFLTEADLDRPEVHYPLRVHVCSHCFLVQVGEYKAAREIFDADYVYYSSVSSSWVEHCRAFVEGAVKRFGLGRNSHVVELASNDGYLLQFFRKAGVPCLGIEPSDGPAEEARQKGIPTRTAYFGNALARELTAEGLGADLIVANNVLAHVPDIRDFVQGCARLLKPGGRICIEHPHLLRLMVEGQFDTIYHEHFSYLSLGSTRRIYRAFGLEPVEVEELPTHGGSLRVHLRHGEEAPALHASVERVLADEKAHGLEDLATYDRFQAETDARKASILEFLLARRREGKTVAAYGAAAKGNTLLNYCGIRPDLLPYVVDRSPHKRGKFLPGSRIPVVGEEQLRAHRPDYVWILPWNLRREISEQLAYLSEWGGQFVVAVPEIEVFSPGAGTEGRKA